ncbi:L-lysine 2,3-aminomutase [Planctomycetes bacterium MalM25]|nr:L-lysine 2,3-aminomutase [Planctomycetes bacterium MalM25]
MSDLVDDRFAEKTTSHLRRLAESSPAIREMYLFNAEEENLPAERDADLFLEKQLTRTKGLIYKYRGRVLVLLSYTCAANCRYCERQDRVGVGLDEEGRLTEKEIDSAVEFVAQRPEITEVIFSGGDPLTHPKGLLYASSRMSEIGHVRMLRIHTRYPLQLPEKVEYDLMKKVAQLGPTPYLSLHVDHPDELTPETEEAITRLRQLGYILLCQSVFLRGVNDDEEVLYRLFTRLSELGVRPYYLYHCHPIRTTLRFVVPIEDEIRLMSRLRERLSGVACPQHIFEVRQTTGKLPVPTDHWNVELDKVRDFVGNEHELTPSTSEVDHHVESLEHGPLIQLD